MNCICGRKKLDVKNNKYDMETLADNIYNIDLWDIIKYQVIDAHFAVYYILNTDYQLTDVEDKIRINDIIKYQPHIKIDELLDIYLFGIHNPSKINYPTSFDFEKNSHS
jgi:hypothetical protein